MGGKYPHIAKMHWYLDNILLNRSISETYASNFYSDSEMFCSINYYIQLYFWHKSRWEKQVKRGEYL